MTTTRWTRRSCAPVPAPARPLRRGAAAALLALASLAAGCSDGASTGGPVPSGTAAPASDAPVSPAGVASSGSASSGSATPTSPAPTSPAPATPAPERAPGITDADLAAGVRTLEVPAGGPGATQVVPGGSPAPAAASVRSIRVEVEQGLDVDGAAFADFVMATLNDPRGWGAGGAVGFSRTDGPADVRLVLASPDTSRRMCRPLETYGRLSCRIGDTVVLTNHRWTLGMDEYGEDRTGYRQYLVNHEVGHALGHAHVPCPGPGQPAPTMMQQTKGLDGCRPNPWPNP